VTAIVGHSMVVLGNDEPWRSPLQLQSEACRIAMHRAGLESGQIDGLLTARAPGGYRVSQFNLRLVTELKVTPRLTTEVTAHGAGALGMLQVGALALDAGIVDYVLCSSGGAPHPEAELASSLASTEADPQFEAPFGATAPSLYALAMRRYLHETGATHVHCAKVAVEARRWALHHPLAMMRTRGEITVEDVLASPVIASPLRRLDCAPFYPGGIATAVVLARDDRATDHTDEPAYLVGIGQRTTHDWITERLGISGYPRPGDGPNLTCTGALSAATDAYAMAKITPDDVDFAQTSAPFSFFALMMLEEFGFCGRGEAAAFVDDGGIEMEKGRPFNTSGGYLSFGQSAQGMYLLEESLEQLSGRAQGRQVQGARIGLVHGHGGPLACHCVALVASTPEVG
jgi:acetyl-CoA acetyltransferase